MPTFYFHQLSKPKHIIARLTLLYICARIIDIYSMEGFTLNVPIHAISTSKNVFDIPYQRLYQIGFKGLILI